MQFVEFLGGAALAGKMVAVYRDGEAYTLKAETVGAKPVVYSYRDAKGRRHHRTLPALTLSPEEYEALVDRVTSGVVGHQDARIVHRALIELGWPDE